MQKTDGTKEPLIIIKPKRLKGEDGYQYVSIRAKDKTVVALNKIAKQTDQSRNAIINIFLEYAVTHYYIDDS